MNNKNEKDETKTLADFFDYGDFLADAEDIAAKIEQYKVISGFKMTKERTTYVTRNAQGKSKKCSSNDPDGELYEIEYHCPRGGVYKPKGLNKRPRK